MKKLVRVLIFSAVAVSLLAFASPAGAKDHISENIDVGGETLEGVLDGPGSGFISARHAAILDSLIQFRDNFIPEMIGTIEDI